MANLRNPVFVASLGKAGIAAPPSAPIPGISSAGTQPSSTAAANTVSIPLERIKRSYNESGFRQAAFALEQIEAQSSGALPSAQRAEALVASGNQYLNTGLLVEAEREFGQALAANPASATAHAGLAQIRERTGERDDARSEAQRSLELGPNVAAHLVLARLDLLTSQLPAAAQEVQAALRIAPTDANARGLKQAVESRGQPVTQ
jgi:tetratricopeptide (TPR) repeat protein